MNLPNIGDTVFVTDDNLPAEFNGTHGIVKTVDTIDGATMPIFVEFTRMDGTTRALWVREGHYSVTEAAVEVKPSEEVGIISSLQAQVTRLSEELAVQARRATAAEERLTEQQRRYSHDMGEIQRIMRDVKGEQDWCDDGYNSVVRRVNDAMEGGWEFEEFRSLVRRTVTVRGETSVDVEVWVRDGDDKNDTDNWLDEEGYEIGDPDEFMQENLKQEFSRCGSQFDNVEVS